MRLRETLKKVKAFRDEGCLAVDMEASALFSIARFRRKHIAGLFIAWDCVAGETSDPRMRRECLEKIRDERRKLFGYVLDAFRLLNEHRKGKRAAPRKNSSCARTRCYTAHFALMREAPSTRYEGV
ncbi:TPA: hypothetical protein EYP44_03840 [Candidatus Bathyarchaeota archaeon]|nr:hypothetical protein [Candidatus Bathyarchaeota archaeon]